MGLLAEGALKSVQAAEQQRVDRDGDDGAGDQQVAASLRQKVQREGQVTDDERELPDLGQTDRHGQRGPGWVAQHRHDADRGQGLHHQHDRQPGGDQGGLAHHKHGIKEHPHRHEEQHRERIAEREHVGAGLLADRRLGHDHARQERAECDRSAKEVGRAHRDRDAEHQNAEGEEFAGAELGDPDQQARDDLGAAHDDDGHRGQLGQRDPERDEPVLTGRAGCMGGVGRVGDGGGNGGDRFDGVCRGVPGLPGGSTERRAVDRVDDGRPARQRGDQHQRDDRDDVLDDQPADGGVPGGRLHLPGVGEHPDQHHRAGDAHGNAQNDARGERPAEGQAHERAGQRGEQALADRAGDCDAANGDQVLEVEVEAHAEHHEDDADLGQLLGAGGIADEARGVGADEHARKQVADDW